MSEKTFTVAAPSNVDITLDDGSPAYRLKAGLNHDVPDAVAHHWYAKASGCAVVTAEAKPDKGKKGKKPDEPTLAERANAVGLDDVAGLADDELLKLVEEAEAKAKAGQ